MALFGSASDGRREPRSLVEFRAGRMTLAGSTVTADTRKGLVFMKMMDSLLHFCWKDRQNGDLTDVSVRLPRAPCQGCGNYGPCCGVKNNAKIIMSYYGCVY